MLKRLARKMLKIAVIQFKVIPDFKEENLLRALGLIEESANNGAKLVCLPSTFSTGVNFPSIKRVAEDDNGLIITKLSNLAFEKKIHIIGGYLEREGNDIYDSAFVIGPKGKVIGKYRRCFLWTGERDFLTQGKLGHVIETEFGPIGLLIGYDIRFPISCINYFKEKAIAIVCLNLMFEDLGFPIESISRARAADNASYFILSNGVGTHKYLNKPFMGKSCIIDGTIENLKKPRDSDILAQAGQQETILYGELDIGQVKKYQNKDDLPLFEDYNLTMEKIVNILVEQK